MIGPSLYGARSPSCASPAGASDRSSPTPSSSTRRAGASPTTACQASHCRNSCAHDAVPAAALDRLADEVGGLVAAIASIDPAASPETIHRDDGIDTWHAELPSFVAAIDHLLTLSERAAVERFLATPSPPPPDPAELVLCHNDLGAEHVLVDPSTFAVTGVIDWTDAAIADPAAEIGRLVRDLGAPRLDAVLGGLGAAGERRAGLVERGWAYARCLILEDLAYAVDHRPELVAAEHASLGRLFTGV